MKTGFFAVVILLAVMYACERWKYKECRSVGHGAFYCLTEVGE